MLSTNSRNLLAGVGFSAAQIAAFEQSATLTAKIEHFLVVSGGTLEATTGATQWSGNRIQINFGQVTSTEEAVRLLTHELGHATGTQQANATSAYNNPGAYNTARTTGEGEAIWLEFRTSSRTSGSDLGVRSFNIAFERQFLLRPHTPEARGNADADGTEVGRLGGVRPLLKRINTLAQTCG